MNGLRYIVCFFAFASSVSGDNSIDPHELLEISYESSESLFVSLGSYCASAAIIKNSGLRKAAYPFDWIFSLDNQGLILAIEEGLGSLLEDEYLIPDNYLIPNSSGASLVHSKYCFEFVHEGDFRGLEYEENMTQLRKKYSRRIDRFNDLNSYKGTVIFIRRAYEISFDDPNRTFKPKEIINITDEDALALYEALKRKFPDLSLKLVVMNSGYTDRIIIEKFLNPNVMKINAVIKFSEELADIDCTELTAFFLKLPQIFEKHSCDDELDL